MEGDRRDEGKNRWRGRGERRVGKGKQVGQSPVLVKFVDFSQRH